VSKDRDFFERSLIHGPPPQVVHVTVGNCSNETLLITLDSLWADIQRALNRESPLLVVTTSRVHSF
jgi:predicted nuclease of predicted toxin-antitoxin system